MQSLETSISQIKQEFQSKLEAINSLESLEQFRIDYLGRQGKISQLLNMLGQLSLEDKKRFGPELNQLKIWATDALEQKKELLEQAKLKQALHAQHFFDVTAYKKSPVQGHLHIFTQMIQKLEDIFITMGYEIVTGPEVVSDYYNFQALNIPADHPARELQDTFWLTNPEQLLRTHTSTVQIQTMEKQSPPLAIVSIGRVFRNEATDATHDFQFMQIEGLCIDKGLSVSNLLATAKAFLRAVFEKEDLEIRARPGYFPFVEPAIEIDASCPFCKTGCSICKYTTWIELLGSGMVHPNVLQMSGIDPNIYSGFAWGMGLERLTMVKYGITDIRLFRSGNIEFLKQF